MVTTLGKAATTAMFVMAGLMNLLVAAGGLAQEQNGHGPAAAAEPDHHATVSSGPSLSMPVMSSPRGRKAFAAKGCVTCHSINGVGSHDAPNLDAHSMEPFMNPFEFAARMWRGAATMIALQEEALGYQIELTGEELADIIAFVHDDEEQHQFSPADIPPEIMALMHHEHAPRGPVETHAEEIGHQDKGDHPHD